MMLVRLQNKSENDLYIEFSRLLPLLYKIYASKCRREGILRNYNGPKVA